MRRHRKNTQRAGVGDTEEDVYGGIYAYLCGHGFSADYLDRCTLWDLDLFTRQVNQLQEKQGPKW